MALRVARSGDQAAPEGGDPGAEDAVSQQGNRQQTIESRERPGYTDLSDQHQCADPLRVLQGKFERDAAT